MSHINKLFGLSIILILLGAGCGTKSKQVITTPFGVVSSTSTVGSKVLSTSSGSLVSGSNNDQASAGDGLQNHHDELLSAIESDEEVGDVLPDDINSTDDLEIHYGPLIPGGCSFLGRLLIKRAEALAVYLSRFRNRRFASGGEVFRSNMLEARRLRLRLLAPLWLTRLFRFAHALAIRRICVAHNMN